jgi:hypothetical protein
MKLLIIGIDGGTERIFDHFDMPFWSKLKCEGQVIPIREDLLHRGWAKMISGQMATENGSFYFRPKLDGTRDFTDKYNLLDMRAAPGFQPIWKFPIEAGADVGVMNIPTVAPPEELPGFFVAGGGGGVYTGGLPDGSCHPRSVKRILEDHGYIFDVRLGAQGFGSRTELCTQLEQMMERRTDSFIQLAKNRVQFGFLAYRATTVLLYLAMYEIERMMQEEGPSSDRSYDSPWVQFCASHFNKLDGILERLVSELDAENYMIVSDHSMVPYRFDADLNFLFSAVGLARFGPSLFTTTINLARIALRPGFRRIVGGISGLGNKVRAVRFCGEGVRNSSCLFGAHYVTGAYVNDRRFNGPVGDSNIDSLVDKAIDYVNASPEALNAGWRAIPYRRNYLNHHFSDTAPDIKIVHDGSTFFNAQAGASLRDNENFRPVTSVLGVSGMHSGQKGDRPLVMMNKELAGLISDSDPRDLRLVHTLTRRLFVGS